ncbi:response regulator transcription factor [Actinobaculum massiliense]|uniref:response regulator transcription factor n=1 Tax=Actinobaculum massiliense TaxID=202789 RepID=UPI002889E4FC|nr:response regulator transcription factor [Actinobaculum massiliense]
MKVIVADDSALFREGLVGILERRKHEVLAQVTSAAELIEAVRAANAKNAESSREADGSEGARRADDAVASEDEKRSGIIAEAGRSIDVVITDVRMPPNMTDDGLRAAVGIRREFPNIGIVVLSQYVAPAYARELFAPSTSATPGFGAVDASDDAGGGLAYLLKDRVARVADFLRSLEVVAGGGVVIDPEVAGELMRGQPSQLAMMTERELEILDLMAKGLSNSELAERLYLSAATISKHVASIFMKLGVGPGEENRRVRAVLAYLTEKNWQK